MSSYKEIVTKTVIGKGKKNFTNKYSIKVNDNVSNILGCWVINHKFKGYKTNDKVGVNGSYDVNIWYSYEGDTKTAVVNKNISYNELFNVKLKENSDLNGDTDIIIRSLRQPNCTDIKSDNKTITFDIEKELGVEVVGDTKVKIAVEEDEEPWDILDEELNNNDIEDINKIDDNFIK